MTVKIKGIVPLRKTLQNIEKFISSSKSIENTADEGIEIIKDKTGRGVDYKHRKFEPYSIAYAKKKRSSKVNLRVSGKMLGSIAKKVINANHVRIFIKRARAVIGAVHSQGTRKMPQREFFNLSKSSIAKLVKKHYDDPLMKIMKRK